MENNIHIGSKIDKEFGDRLGEVLGEVLNVGSNAGTDQVTIQKALDVVEGVFSTAVRVDSVAVSDCYFDNKARQDEPAVTGGGPLAGKKILKSKEKKYE